MKPEIPADYYTFHCWSCDAMIKVEITTIADMIKEAKSKDWSVAKGRTYCPKHNPERSEDAKNT